MACRNAKSYSKCLYDAQGNIVCENNGAGGENQYASGSFIETFEQQSKVAEVKNKIMEMKASFVSGVKELAHEVNELGS